MMMLFAGGAQLTVGEVAECCGLGQSTTSEQLTILRRGGLVQSTRQGKTVRYCTDPTTIATRLNELQSYLARCCPPSSTRSPGRSGPAREAPARQGRTAASGHASG
jgi:DNA-binding IclR family transcriptional regulator